MPVSDAIVAGATIEVGEMVVREGDLVTVRNFDSAEMLGFALWFDAVGAAQLLTVNVPNKEPGQRRFRQVAKIRSLQAGEVVSDGDTAVAFSAAPQANKGTLRAAAGSASFGHTTSSVVSAATATTFAPAR